MTFIKFKCFIGLHQWTPWKEVEGSFNDDPGGWFLSWTVTRQCKCCNTTVDKHLP